MTARTWCALLFWIPASVAGAGACGGSAFEGSPGGAGSGATAGSSAQAGTTSTGATAGVGTGGSSNTGGSTSVGGANSGGMGNVGNTGGVGTAGSGNAGGTAGTGGVDMTACTQNSQCKLEPVSCCSCGMGPISNYTAINVKWDSTYNQRCNAVDCAACPPVAFNPDDPVNYYVPTCEAGHCTLVDLKTTDMTACATASDCILRNGTACCEGCGVNSNVALNQQHLSELSKLVCDSNTVGCPACLPPQPSGTPSCISGRCVVSLGACTQASPCPL